MSVFYIVKGLYIEKHCCTKLLILKEYIVKGGRDIGMRIPTFVFQNAIYLQVKVAEDVFMESIVGSVLTRKKQQSIMVEEDQRHIHLQ